jgi:transposase-like protein
MYFNRAMPNPYDVALRKRAVLAYERGEGSYAEVADLCDLNPRTLERWVARWRTAASFAPRPRGGGWRSPIDLAVLRVLVREGPDATLAEMCTEYNRRVPRRPRTTRASLHRALVRDGFVVKTNARGRRRSIGRTSRPSAPPS